MTDNIGRIDLDETGLGCFQLGPVQSGLQLLQVVGVRDRLHVPVVGLVALVHVLREGDGCVSVDRYQIVVIANN